MLLKKLNRAPDQLIQLDLPPYSLIDNKIDKSIVAAREGYVLLLINVNRRARSIGLYLDNASIVVDISQLSP